MNVIRKFQPNQNREKQIRLSPVLGILSGNGLRILVAVCEEEVYASQGDIQLVWGGLRQTGIQCQRCHILEHCKCAKISVGEYNLAFQGLCSFTVIASQK